MDKKLTILLNEYSAIKDFRERCIKNIEETTRTYLIFLGFGATAITVIFEKEIPVLYLLLILLTCLYTGISIYKLNVASHINFINYTRKLNKTRWHLKKFGVKNKYFLLPTNGESPPFDRIGFTNKKFSDDGVLKLIQTINSVIGFGLAFSMFNAIEEIYFLYIFVMWKIFTSFLFALVVYYFHTIVNCNLIREAEIQWKENKKKEQ